MFHPMTKRFLNKNERRFERGILGILTFPTHQGCLRDYQRTGGSETDTYLKHKKRKKAMSSATMEMQ